MTSSGYNEFILTHVFENVSSLKEGENNYSDVEEHFGVPWCLSASRRSPGFAIFLYCDKMCKEGNWSIDTDFEIKIMSVNGKMNSKNASRCFQSSEDMLKADGVGWVNFIEWDQMEKDYAVDDKIFVEARFLASQSTYFKSLFLGNFEESKKSEISLADVNSEDFQNFLEVLHGEDAVNDETVDGILSLADMYDAPTAIRRCEQFMIEKSEKSFKTKLQMSTRYEENFCLVKIKTKEDIRSVLPGDLSELDPSVSSHLMHLFASLA
ncbi:hypothetical protein GCK72_007394 [Caenorhabditis remanei]|uniref:BTB domain-containing protein n=1 Tax=Caenorhabditis remanei TaxID=31234 RepID=A0A6A5HIY2_CAERE|nr:hypothetical protein GCK72_007394 [Caenorhabditis remanei]KAF1767435.1 hypothetical protein GCK72_007394 [Caenorhabditis remanei]